MASSKKLIFDDFKIVENFWFLIFCTQTSSDESQSKAQFNLQSLGENKTVTENRFFSTDENFKKSPHLFALIFMPSW